MSEKQSAILGWIGTLLAVIMYVSYVPQIINNCTIWVIYSLTKKNRDYPVAAANAPGIIFGLISAITAVI